MRWEHVPASGAPGGPKNLSIPGAALRAARPVHTPTDESSVMNVTTSSTVSGARELFPIRIRRHAAEQPDLPVLAFLDEDVSWM